MTGTIAAAGARAVSLAGDAGIAARSLALADAARPAQVLKVAREFRVDLGRATPEQATALRAAVGDALAGLEAIPVTNRIAVLESTPFTTGGKFHNLAANESELRKVGTIGDEPAADITYASLQFVPRNAGGIAAVRGARELGAARYGQLAFVHDPAVLRRATILPDDFLERDFYAPMRAATIEHLEGLVSMRLANELGFHARGVSRSVMPDLVKRGKLGRLESIARLAAPDDGWMYDWSKVEGAARASLRNLDRGADRTYATLFEGGHDMAVRRITDWLTSSRFQARPIEVHIRNASLGEVRHVHVEPFGLDRDRAFLPANPDYWGELAAAHGIPFSVA